MRREKKFNKPYRDDRRGDDRREDKNSRRTFEKPFEKKYQSRYEKEKSFSKDFSSKSGHRKTSSFNPSFDLIVSIVAKDPSIDMLIDTVKSVIDININNKKIIICLDKNSFANSAVSKINSFFKNNLVECYIVQNPNHHDGIFNLSKGFARHYLVIESGIELCPQSCEKMILFLNDHSSDYYAVSPAFYDKDGGLVKSCKRFPNLIDLIHRTIKPESYHNSQSYLLNNMLERGEGGYLKIHSVANPIMDCMIVDGKFIVEKRPFCTKYKNQFLNNLKFAKNVVRYNKKIVYFPLARVIKNSISKYFKPSLFEMFKFFITTGIALRYKPSN